MAFPVLFLHLLRNHGITYFHHSSRKRYSPGAVPGFEKGKTGYVWDLGDAVPIRTREKWLVKYRLDNRVWACRPQNWTVLLILIVNVASNFARFNYRAMLCIRGTSHGPVSVSVCPSVTSRSSTKTAKRRITQTTQHNSPGTLVF